MAEAKSPRRRWYYLLLGIGGVLLIAVGAFLVWALWIPAPMPEALAAMESDSAVTASQNGWITFTPVDDRVSCGIIFYPGGRVDPRAYAPPMHAIAAEGYTAVIVPMPLNLAILGINKASDVIAGLPKIETWSVAGHSLGGSAAAFYIHDNPHAAQGLALWAAYTTEGMSLADRDALAVTSISASLDGLATPEKIEEGAPYLPPQTTFVEIEGGNHAQFGWYGDQSGDNPATITREEQQAQTIAATLELLDATCAGK